MSLYHPFWALCVFVRFMLIISINRLHTPTHVNLGNLLLLCIGLGFCYKAMFGSNNEYQISQVYWHETRYVHGILFLLSAYYLWRSDQNMSILCLIVDLLFSVIYVTIYKARLPQAFGEPLY